MDAAREGHADIASMLREAGASDAVSAAEAAPLHKVTNYITARWFQPSPRRTPLLPYIPTHTHTHTHTHVLQGAVAVRVAGADYGSVDSTSQLRNRRRA